ncbi:hypothetical protein M0657_002989 [Pyricularia oryzae]|nr:hypothetical protein M9X92_002328 [Pyricularia oryzae]KAI7927870.1 hypothetical protein M0657_002989 [Pyricularia oryzae]
MAWQFCTTHHLARAVMDGLAGPVACAPSHLHTKASSVPWQAAPLSSDEVSVL